MLTNHELICMGMLHPVSPEYCCVFAEVDCVVSNMTEMSCLLQLETTIMVIMKANMLIKMILYRRR